MKANEVLIWIKDRVDLSGLKSAKESLTKFAGAVKSAFKVAATAVGTVTAAISGTVVEAVRFNTQMARVWTMAGGGIKNFQDLREEARGLSSDFGIARSEMANGMYNALSAGVDKAGLESFMAQAAKVAVADGSDVSTAVDGITTVLNAFGKESSDTESIADQLFKTVKQGKTTFSELASNIATVAPMAAASGIPLEEILAHVSGLTAQGTPTAQAMTQIRASIQGLNKALGDGWSENMTYQEALKKVWELAGESQTELLKMVGSTEAIQAVLGGVGENADSAKEKLQGMADSAGSTQEAFEQQDGFRHWNKSLETARGTLSKFGEMVDQRIAPYVDRVTDKIRAWQEDQGLWDAIGQFLDKAEEKLQAVADIASQIQSMDDLIALGEAVGSFMKERLELAGKALLEWLVTNGPEAIKQMFIAGMKLAGSDMAKWAFETFNPVGQIKKTGDRVVDTVGGWLGFGDEEEDKKPAARSFTEHFNEAKNAQNEAAQKVEIAVQEITELKSDMEQVTEKTKEVSEEAKESADASIETLDSVNQTSESVKQSADSAKSMAEEAKKASDASNESNTLVQKALSKSTDVSSQTLQVARTANEQLGQLTQAVSILAGQQAQTNANVELALGQIANMRM